MSYQNSASDDRQYLAELIRDFPAKGGPPADSAWTVLAARYQALSSASQYVVDNLRSNPAIDFPKVFGNLCRTFHLELFSGILSNAGAFRKTKDINNGYVGFGKGDARQPTGSSFNGTRADLIERELKKVFARLSKKDASPEQTAIVFYQLFVRIHPFYDANGRIGRLLVSIYLLYHNRLVLWKELETTKKASFLKRLNDCHKRTDPANIGKVGYSLHPHREHLIAFWRKFILSRDELDIPPSAQ